MARNWWSNSEELDAAFYAEGVPSASHGDNRQDGALG